MKFYSSTALQKASKSCMACFSHSIMHRLIPFLRLLRLREDVTRCHTNACCCAATLVPVLAISYSAAAATYMSPMCLPVLI